MPDALIPGKPGPALLLRLAVRNLLRNRRRTVLTVITVAFAVLFLQIWDSMLRGLERQSYDNLIHYQTAHAKVYEEAWFELRDELPLDRAIQDPAALLDEVLQVPGVAAAVPRIVFQAHLSDGRDQIPVQGLAIETAGSDSDVFRIPEAVVAGSYLPPDGSGLLLGSGLARIFDVGPGGWMTVLVRTRTGVWEAQELQVTGVVTTGNPSIDQNTFLMGLEPAREMLDMQGRATELAIRFAPTASERTVLNRLNERFASRADLRVAGWREQEAEFIALTEGKRGGGLVAMAIFVVVALVGVANTMLLAAFERTQEIGMLLAMGMRRASVRRLFLVEGALTGLGAGALGTLVALIPIFHFAHTGIDFSAMFSEDMDIGYPVAGRVYWAVSPAMMIAAWVGTAVLAAGATLYAAVRASRLEPAEALRRV
jgi:ABC-type lipoprotein release transport system permease subunit